MKVKYMKEKKILSLSVIFLIGIMIISKKNKKDDLDLSLIKYTQPELIDETYLENSNEEMIDNDIKTSSNEEIKIIYQKESITLCDLKINQTDSFSFSDAFKYYRNCLSKNENFSWRGKTYTTFLNSEKNNHLTDSSKIKNITEEISEEE